VKLRKSDLYSGWCPFCGAGFFGHVSNKKYRQRKCETCGSMLYPADKRAMHGTVPHALTVEIRPPKGEIRMKTK
jgi:hypothetical protein